MYIFCFLRMGFPCTSVGVAIQNHKGPVAVFLITLSTCALSLTKQTRQLCERNIARIAKAASHNLPRKSSLNVSFVLYCTVLSCPDHGDYDDHGDQEEVGGCTQGSWRLSDQMQAHCLVDCSE